MRRDNPAVVATPIRTVSPDAGAEDVLRLVRRERLQGRQEEVEDSPFATPEPRPRSAPAPRRYVYPWEKQAMTWKTPELRFTCCGTIYAAMTAGELELMRSAHNKSSHGSQ